MEYEMLTMTSWHNDGAIKDGDTVTFGIYPNVCFKCNGAGVNREIMRQTL